MMLSLVNPERDDPTLTMLTVGASASLICYFDCNSCIGPRGVSYGAILSTAKQGNFAIQAGVMGLISIGIS
jgi:hypothetical protein